MIIKGKTVWITGASSGIGEQLVYTCARRGAKLIISSNQETELNTVKKNCEKMGVECFVTPFDLSKPKEVNDAGIAVLEKFKSIDVLINNGGISQRATVVDTSMETIRKIMEINFMSAVTLSKLVLPGMIENGTGVIAATSSITGKFGFPLRSAYAASKHAVLGFFETLRLENKANNIQVTVAIPGRVQTDISVNAVTGKGAVYGKMDDGQSGGISAEDCAEQYIKAIEKNKKEVLIGGKELMMVHIKRFFPALFNRMATKIKAT
ncbi:MAG: short chain dehydrogenase [Bacteroidetes bacterium]|nr:MAG: short chain dehydrogenase [Bacteroidota bacterium]